MCIVQNIMKERSTVIGESEACYIRLLRTGTCVYYVIGERMLEVRTKNVLELVVGEKRDKPHAKRTFFYFCDYIASLIFL